MICLSSQIFIKDKIHLRTLQLKNSKWTWQLNFGKSWEIFVRDVSEVDEGEILRMNGISVKLPSPLSISSDDTLSLLASRSGPGLVGGLEHSEPTEDESTPERLPPLWWGDPMRGSRPPLWWGDPAEGSKLGERA